MEIAVTSRLGVEQSFIIRESIENKTFLHPGSLFMHEPENILAQMIPIHLQSRQFHLLAHGERTMEDHFAKYLLFSVAGFVPFWRS